MSPESNEQNDVARDRKDAALASTLTRRRDELATNFLPPLLSWSKYGPSIGEGSSRDEFIARELHCFVDYLALYFRTGDPTYKHLYAGEKLKMLHCGDEDLETRRRRGEDMLAQDREAMLRSLRGQLRPESMGRLEEAFSEIGRLVLATARTTLEVLMVGDCLFLDLQAFLVGPCLEDDIAINPTFATSKNGASLRNSLKGMAGRKFDLVLYSPVTYAFSLPMFAYFSMKKAFEPASRIRAAVDEAMADVDATLGVLATCFECPIFVHNTVNIYRHTSNDLGPLKNIVTRRSRHIARDRFNERIVEAVGRRNAETFEHLHLFDESRTLATRSSRELERMFYGAFLQHPGVLGLALAELYRDVLAAHARLSGRKLVVCDLDNTLWDGVIGEGPVAHYHDRQRILQRLKAKGIVLAVNSKNDPSKVHWTGGLLNETDFVAMQINWDSKVTNMKRLREALNLKYKDYVFIDDRGDQLEMVSSSFPEMQVMDATSDRTWKLLDTWASLLPDQVEGDRTQLYHERRLREAAVAEIVEEDPAEMFAKLEIGVTIRQAVRSDLQRVTELVNRTNQFNCAGSRTNFNEVVGWDQDPRFCIMVVEASDKFGQMGLISVAVVRKDEASWTIPVFVLSCRVFGYGIETALLNSVKRLAREALGKGFTIRGDYRETPHNGPCKSTYPDNGFVWDGQAWVFDGTEIPADPSWLSVDDRILSKASSPVGQV